MHKKLALVLLIGYIGLLTFLSLINIVKINSLGSSFDDKIHHFIAYFGLTVLLYLYIEKTTLKYKMLYIILIPILYGIIIEVLQGMLANLRKADFYDVIANTIGVFLAIIAITLRKKLKLK